MRRSSPLALVLALSTFACTRGSGVHGSEVREVGEFTALGVDGALVVNVAVGLVTRVEVSGDDNIVPEVRTRVDGGVLRVEMPTGSITTTLPLTVIVATPALHELDVEGASTVDVRGVSGERFDVELEGASVVDLRGEVQTLDADVEGASTLRANELTAHTAEIEASGASRVEVSVSDSLRAEASGASTIRYRGEPGTLKPHVSGASTIEAASE